MAFYGPQKAHKHKHFKGGVPTLMGFFIRGFIWDVPILIFASVPVSGPGVVLFRGREGVWDPSS